MNRTVMSTKSMLRNTLMTLGRCVAQWRSAVASAVVLFLSGQVAYSDIIDMYVSHVGGVNKYFYDVSTDAITVDAGFSLLAGSGGLTEPQGLAVGPDNLLYVVSQDSDQILRYNRTTGAFVSVVGAPSVPQDLGFGPDLSGDGVPDLYVAEFSSGNVVRIPTQGPGAGTVNAFATGLNTVTGMTYGPDGRLYVSSRNLGRIEKFNETTGADLGVFATKTNASTALFSPDGSKFYSASTTATTLSQYDGTTGALINGSFGTGLGGPAQATFGPDFNNNGALDIFVANNGSGATTVSIIDGLDGGNPLGDAVTGLNRPKDILFIGNIAIPEPGSACLFVIGGLIALGSVRRRVGH